MELRKNLAFRRWGAARTGLAGLAACAAGLVLAPSALANHGVQVEGNCQNPPDDPAFTTVEPLACGDYDGDGLIGTAEDNDNDRVFGTLNGAISTGNSATRLNQNGSAIVVTSGVFAETVNISGNVTLEAAPGVDANIDAFVQGDDAASNTARQGQPGIVVDAPDNRAVVIRNIRSTNWTSGIQVKGDSSVTVEDVEVDHNINYGIEVLDNAEVNIANTEVSATGFRVNPATGDFPTTSPPDPGRGIEFSGGSDGNVFNTTVTGSFDAGIADESSERVCVAQVSLLDNNPNLFGFSQNMKKKIRKGQISCT